MAFHLLGQVFSCAWIGQAQAIFVDQHRLLAQPLCPGLLRHVLEDALAELARIGREIQALGFAAELDAIYRACHRRNPDDWRSGNYLTVRGVRATARRFQASVFSYTSERR